MTDQETADTERIKEIKFANYKYLKACKENNLPAHMHGGIVDYIVGGYPIGDFLTKLFSNDLTGAMGQADEKNLAAIQDYGGFIYNDIPCGCWGSKEKVANWKGLYPKP